MSDAQRSELVTISEFAGGFPDVPLAPGVDLDAIKADDPAPFFVTLPVSKVGATSRSGLTYGEEANRQIVEQINAKKPEGRLGHLREDERATRYDLPAWRALGAALVGDTVWGKFYVPQSRADVREHFKLAMRTNARAGVSLYGGASIDPGKREVKALNIESIDIADPERVGLPVAARPMITANMADEPATDTHKETEPMSEETTRLMQEMTDQRDKARADLEAAQQRMAEMEQQVKEAQQRMAEMAQFLNVEVDALPAKLAEMRLENRTNEVVKVVAEMVELEELRSTVMAHLGNVENLPHGEELKGRIQQVMAKEDVKRLAEMLVKAKGGPGVALGAADNRKGADDAGLEQRAKDDARRLGMTRR